MFTGGTIWIVTHGHVRSQFWEVCRVSFLGGSQRIVQVQLRFECLVGLAVRSESSGATQVCLFFGWFSGWIFVQPKRHTFCRGSVRTAQLSV